MKIGLVGKSIDYSLSPLLHKTFGNATNRTLKYSLIDTSGIQTKNFTELLTKLQAEGYRGINVTIPYKTEAFDICNYFIGRANTIGAVNTLLFNNWKITGLNTDYSALKRLIKQHLKIDHESNVLLNGAGGAGKAYAYAMSQTPFLNLFITNRGTARAKLLLQGLKLHGRHVELIDNPNKSGIKFHGLVNATPLGRLKKDELPFKEDLIEKSEFVIDAVYGKEQTSLISKATEKGKRVIGGLDLLFYQGLESFEHFSNLQISNPEILLDQFKKSVMK